MESEPQRNHEHRQNEFMGLESQRECRAFTQLSLVAQASCFLLTTQINNSALYPCAFSGIMSRAGE